jgi:phosphoribosylformylglycinamidine synthase PurS subunit
MEIRKVVVRRLLECENERSKGGGPPGAACRGRSARTGARPPTAARASVICPHRYDADGTVARGAKTVRVEIRVELKPGILDAESDSIQKSLGLLGIGAVSRVSTARVYDLSFVGVPPAEAMRRAREAVDRLLANPVIHTVHVRLVPR